MKNQQKTARRQKRRVERRVRARRLEKIRSAERDLESALLTLKNHFNNSVKIDMTCHPLKPNDGIKRAALAAPLE